MSLVGIAAETLRILEEGGYVGPSGHRVELRSAVDAAVGGTRTWAPDEAQAAVGRVGLGRQATRIEVTEESTQEAGARLVGEGERVAVLNFASARNMGGGFLRGARAQEEELCRCSALYACLRTQHRYYEANRTQRSALYTDHLIYSNEVPFFRDPDRSLRAAPFALSVLTSPAPNTGAVLRVDPDAGPAIAATFRRRAAQVLGISAAMGQEALVLGAWGCGAFQGDPGLVAAAFDEALHGPFAGVFRRVVFAVLVRTRRDQTNLDAFHERFP